MFVSLTFVFYILCFYTYFKHKIAKLCNIVYVKYKVYPLFMQQQFLRVHYIIQKQFCANVPFFVCYNIILYHVGVIFVPGPHIRQWPEQHLYIVKFYSCLYIVRFFRINIQYYCIFNVYLCSFWAISVCLCNNHAVFIHVCVEI